MPTGDLRRGADLRQVAAAQSEECAHAVSAFVQSVHGMELASPLTTRWLLRLCCALPALLLWLTTAGQLAFTPDSVFYWSAARSLLHGDGLKTGVRYDDVLLRQGRRSTPLPAEGE